MQEEIPSPSHAGADGTQVAGQEVSQLISLTTTERGLPSDVVWDYAEGDHRAFGKSQLAVQMTASLLNEKIWDLQRALQKISALEEKLEAKTSEAHDINSQLGIAKERLGSTKSSDWVYQVLNVCAAALIGVAVDIYKSGGRWELLGIIGLVLLLVPSIGIFMRRMKD